MNRILVTNDDGVAAPGLLALAVAALRTGAEVAVAAPMDESSGAGACISVVEDHGRVVLRHTALDESNDVATFAVDGSPALIALLGARGAFGFVPDIVLSGVNRGANIGRSVLHSGTVGAALTAAETGCRAIAVSLNVLPTDRAPVSGTALSAEALAAMVARGEPHRNWETAADLAIDLLDSLAATPPGTVLNLNVPDVAARDVRGVRRTGLARFGQVQINVAESGHGFVQTMIGENERAPTPGTDLALLAAGYATVTPLRSISEALDIDLHLGDADPA